MNRSVLLSLLLVGGICSAGSAQPPPAAGTPRSAPPRGGLAPRDIQQMIDAYVLMQAQDALRLTDDQFPQFVTRLKTLQEARRRQQVGRNRILMELNRLTAPKNPGADDAAIKEQLKALHDHDARSMAEIGGAYDALDQVLNPFQQARLRVFEEQIERRKIDLLIRARQGARATPGSR